MAVDSKASLGQVNKNSILLTLWIMYALFPFRLSGIEIVQNIFYYGFSISLIIVLLWRLYTQKVNLYRAKGIIGYLVIMALLTIMSYLVPILKNTGDTSYFSNYVYYWGRIIILTGTFVFFRNLRQFITLIIDAVNCYVICSLVLLIPSLRTFYSSIVSTSSTTSSDRLEQLYSATYYTRFGLQGFSGFGTTLMCTLAVLLGCYLLILAIRTGDDIGPYATRILISIVGAAMYGRIGLLVSFPIVIIMLVYIALKFGKYKPLIVSIVFIVVLILLFIVFADSLRQIDSINWMFEWAFNFLDTGTFSTQSSTRLSEMYIHPTLTTFLYGDGYYTVMGSYYMSTDVGYLRPLLFWGIFGEILYYLQFLPLMNALGRKLKGHDVSFLLLCLFVLLIAFEAKGESALSVGTNVYMIVGAMSLVKPNVNQDSKDYD